MDKIEKKLEEVKEKISSLKLSYYQDRIGKVIEAYSKLREEYIVPSVESVYERSRSLGNFNRFLKKLISFYEEYLRRLKKFDQEYSELLDKVITKKISEEEAMVQIMNKVTELDEFFDSRIQDFMKG